MTDAAELVKLAGHPVVKLPLEAVYIDDKRNCAYVMLDALKPALAAQQDGAWQPIETAPKDGTAILVCDATHMDSQKIVFWDVDPKNPPGFHWFVEDAGAYHEKAFTHWKPLDPQPL